MNYTHNPGATNGFRPPLRSSSSVLYGNGKLLRQVATKIHHTSIITVFQFLDKELRVRESKMLYLLRSCVNWLDMDRRPKQIDGQKPAECDSRFFLPLMLYNNDIEMYENLRKFCFICMFYWHCLTKYSNIKKSFIGWFLVVSMICVALR